MFVITEAMAASGLFDGVPECMIETLLVVHGSGDRNSAEFTQVCERWTCILAPWIRTWKYGVIHARWNGKYYEWWRFDQLYEKGICCNGKKEGEWYLWNNNNQLAVKKKYRNGNLEGEYQRWHDNGYMREKGVYRNGRREGEWRMWHENGQLQEKGVYCVAMVEF